MNRASGPEPGHAIEQRFDAAMYQIYERAGAELGYWATRYLQMLRRHGGLETARRLLAARTTSDGYARLREERRLDLTVEAHVLLPAFRSLFTALELERARSRLAFYERVMQVDQRAAKLADPGLLRELAEAAVAPGDRRVDFRDRIAAYGVAAIAPLHDWVAAGNSPGFAAMAFEAIGRTDDAEMAVKALRRLATDHRDWSSVINAAIRRLES